MLKFHQWQISQSRAGHRTWLWRILLFLAPVTMFLSPITVFQSRLRLISGHPCSRKELKRTHPVLISAMNLTNRRQWIKFAANESKNRRQWAGLPEMPLRWPPWMPQYRVLYLNRGGYFTQGWPEIQRRDPALISYCRRARAGWVWCGRGGQQINWWV